MKKRPFTARCPRKIEAYRPQLLIEQVNAGYAALRADPEAWAEELRERELWDQTNLDGLESEAHVMGQKHMPPVVRIVSGGQTGADRGGLDAALALGIEHGGWCPAGRVAEDGRVPLVYTLRETTSTGYAERTRANVRHSDATVVFTRGAATGGSALTLAAARKIRKPVLHVDLAKLGVEAAADRVRRWCVERSIAVLNVAGSRESKAPGISDEVRQVLVRALGTLRQGSPK